MRIKERTIAVHDDELAAALDEYIRRYEEECKVMLSRSQAMRQLLSRALEANRVGEVRWEGMGGRG